LTLYGPKLAQVALTVGADDVDAVSPAAAGTGPRRPLGRFPKHQAAGLAQERPPLRSPVR
jgi:hypothetical protein